MVKTCPFGAQNGLVHTLLQRAIQGFLPSLPKRYVECKYKQLEGPNKKEGLMTEKKIFGNP